MPEHFDYTLDKKLPVREFQRENDEQMVDLPLVSELTRNAEDVISSIAEVAALPARNKKLILDMAAYMIFNANHIIHSWDNHDGNQWGLYIVGSRARGEATPDSDLDLLTAGSFYRNMNFLTPNRMDWDPNGIFDGFDIEVPDELPTEYNVGDVDRKYLVRATPEPINPHMKMKYPKPEVVLPVDLNVVDLTWDSPSLADFLEIFDTDGELVKLPRIPIIELDVPATYL